MNNDILKFSINDIHEVSTENSAEFCYARICVLSTKPNSHQVLITDEILRRDGLSVRGKWIVCDFNGIDATTHTDREKIVGIVPHDAKVDFVEEDGYTSMYVDAIISKIYAKEVYDMFKIDNFRNVSVEMMTDDEDTLPNGDIPIRGLEIVGITILGRYVNGSCPNANMSIIKFSVDEAEDYYNSKQFAEESLQSHPVDKSKESVDMGDWNGNKAKDDLLKEKNFKTVAKSVCLLLEDGWEEKRKGSLKYPVMNLKDGKWVYNAEGLSSARAYGEQHDPSVAEKAISIQKRLGLYKDDKEDTMSSEKKFAIDIGNLWCTIYDILESKYPDDDYGSIYRIEGIYEEGTQKFAIIYRKEETTMYRLNITIENDNIVLGEDIVEVEKTYVEQGNVKKFSDENIDSKYKLFNDAEKDVIMEEKEQDKEMAQDNKEEQPKEEETKEMGCGETKAMADEESKEEVKEEKPQEEEKKFSLDAYVDQVAMLAMLEKETEQNKELAEKVMKQMSANEIVEKFVQMSKENAELKAEKEANDTEKRDKKFSAIMASVKEDLDEKKFSELSEEGKNLSLGELGAFENKVKAFAYEATKNKPKQDDDGIMRFAGVSEETTVKETVDDIYKKYL